MFRCTIIVLLFLAQSVLSQPLTVRIESIDAHSLQQIRMKVALTRAGLPLPQPGKAAYLLKENGLEIPIDVNCPDSAIRNSIALVLDNSGSMSGEAFDSLKIGAHSVVDSIHVNDEAAIYDFSNSGERILDFTTDKLALHTAISGMMSSGNTPLYTTIQLALQDLQLRGGKRYCIVFTDGEDNGSSVLWEDLIPLARSAGVHIFTIGFGNNKLSDYILSALAVETGGKYTRIFSPQLIADVFRDITTEILSPYCTISYSTAGCTDSLRFLNLRAELEAQTAFDDTVFASPFRLDTLYARIIAPKRMLPGDRAIIYIALEPGVHTGLELSFNFQLRYDPALIVASPVLPVTIGTITENTGARVQQIALGVLQFSAEFISPTVSADNLIGIVFRHVAADSSRPVPLTLEHFTLTAGCPNTIIALADTIEICQCVESLTYSFDTLTVVGPDATTEFPVHIPLPISDIPKILLARLHFDAKRLLPWGVVDDDGEGWDLQFDRDNGTALLSLYTTSTKIEIVPRLQFLSRGERSPARTHIRIDSVTIYAACCMDAGSDFLGFWIDGRCNFLVREKNVARIESVWPNPAADVIHANVLSRGEQRHAEMELYDARGILLRSMRIDTENISEQEVLIPTQMLPPGRYTLLLRGASSISKRSVLIVR